MAPKSKLNLTNFEDLTDLESLLDLSESNADDTHQVLLIDYNSIIPDPNQPRKKFDQKSLEELAQSIEKNRLRQLPEVKKLPNGQFMIEHGERRWRACGILQWEKMPVILSDDGNLFTQLVENIQREELSPWEIACSIAKLKAQGHKQEDIATQLGKGKSWVSVHVTISEAPAELRKFVEKISDSTALVELVRAFKKAKTSDSKKEILSYLESMNNKAEIGRKDILSFLGAIKTSEANESTPAPAPNLATVDKVTGDNNSHLIAESAASNATTEKNISLATKKGANTELHSLVESTSKEKFKLSTDKLFQSIYTMQTTGNKPTSKILKDLSGEDQTEILHILANAYKQGANIDVDTITTTIAKNFSDGLFAIEGTGLYSFLAFLTGTITKGELTMEQIGTKCLTAAEVIIKS